MYHVSYIKQNVKVLATICKRSQVDKLKNAPVGPFRVRIEIDKNPVHTFLGTNMLLHIFGGVFAIFVTTLNIFRATNS